MQKSLRRICAVAAFVGTWVEEAADSTECFWCYVFKSGKRKRFSGNNNKTTYYDQWKGEKGSLKNTL